MGEVYRAADSRLKRDVAIKVLPAALAQDADRLARFRREAELLAALNHPNIAAVYGLEESEGVVAIVLELVDGEMLGGPLPLADALPIARQIADALEAAHEKGIVHRDLKPANVKVTAAGTVKVLDFGLAKALDSGGGAAATMMSAGGESATRLQTIAAPATTEIGVILGTVAYMSPEQARGKPVDRRTDIWAFGCVLYEILSGARAFPGDGPADTLAHIVSSEPDWRALPADTPPSIVRLLERCLEKDPKRRLHDIADARIEIDDAIARPTQKRVAARAQAAWDRFLWGAASGLVVAMAIAAYAWATRRAPEAAPIVRFDVDAGSPSPSSLALSPDGRQIAANSRAGLWIRALDRVDGRVIAGTAGAAYPFWSPDGRFVAFFAGGKLKKADAIGGAIQTLGDAPNGRGGTWNRDDVIVFAPRTDGALLRIAASGGVAAPVSALDRGRDEVAHLYPWFLPDGRHFLYLAKNANPANTALMVASLDGRDTKRVQTTDRKAAFVPPDRLLFVRDNTLMAETFDPVRFEVRGDPKPVAEQIENFPLTLAAAFSASDTGVLAFQARTQARMLTWLDRAGRALSTVGPVAAYMNVALSPDQRRLATDREDSGGGDIFLVDLDRGTSSRFTFDAARDGWPLWSKDGARVVFSSARDGGVWNLYQRPTNGSSQEELLLRSSGDKLSCCWSRDDRALIYQQRDPKTQWDLWMVPLAGDKKPIPLLTTPFNEYQADLSSDGKWLAYVSDETGEPEVYVQPFPPNGSKWQLSMGGGTQPKWRRDARELFFLDAGAALMSATVSAGAAAEGGTFKADVPVKLFQANVFLGWPKNSYDPSADGQRFLVNVLQNGTLPPLTVVLNWHAGLK